MTPAELLAVNVLAALFQVVEHWAMGTTEAAWELARVPSDTLFFQRFGVKP